MSLRCRFLEVEEFAACALSLVGEMLGKRNGRRAGGCCGDEGHSNFSDFWGYPNSKTIFHKAGFSLLLTGKVA